MAYQALYRRYRSRTFAEVLGQEHVTTALRNAVREGRVAQGYLFSGPRGTGKTSTARILAKALNCLQLDTEAGEPCATCENCVAVESGRAVDWLHELDAASNNGVDAMRDLLGRVGMGTSGQRKVYILDEVHMLSPAASNTLLKTLEEPPDHVVFVLATTEPEKVLPTIRSRTQHFEFRLLGAEVLAAHVRHVIADAGLDLDDDAVDHVVRAGRGSARDTLSALDQVAAAGGVAGVTVPLDAVVAALVAQDTSALLLAVDGAVRSGRDPRTIGAALIEELRNAFLAAMGAPATGLTDTAAARARDVAETMGPATVTRTLELIGAALVDMGAAPDPRVPLEVALIQAATPAIGGTAEDQIRALAARVDQLERALAGGATPPAAAPVGAGPADPGVPAPAPVPAPADTAGAPEAPRAASPAPAAGAPRGAAAARAAAERAAAQSRSGAEAPTTPASPAGGADKPTLGSLRRAREGAAVAPGDPAVSHAPGDQVGAPAEPPPSSEPVPAPAPADAPAPPRDPAPEPARPAPAASETSGLPDAVAVRAAWEQTVLESLRGRAKASFKVGRIIEVTGTTIRFGFPNEHYVTNCASKAADVEAALTEHFGCPVRIDLAIDAGGAAPDAAASSTAGTARSAPVDDRADEVDLDELADAPDAVTHGITQLQDAFPGAEILEER